ncbi:MAG: hypothetical protein ACRC6V_03870 [Bacteroidales bacterium]
MAKSVKAQEEIKKKPAKKADKPAKKADKPAKKADKPAKKSKLLAGKSNIQFKRNSKTAERVGGWEITDLQAASYNPRVISEKELANLESSIKQFGDLSGVVFNRFTGTLVSGHQRLKSMSSEKIRIKTTPVKDKFGTVEEGYVEVKSAKGIIRIPMRIVDWSERKAELAANIAANAHGGSWDHRKLAAMTEDLELEEFDIMITGLDEVTLKSMRHLTENTKGKQDKEVASSDSAFPEYDSESFEEDLQHTCPRCMFRFG